MKKLKILLILFVVFQIIILLFLNWQCSKRPDLKPLDEKVFVQVYCDVVVYADLLDAKRKEAFVDSVLNNYNTNREQFQYTVSYYSKDETKWEKVFTDIVAELEKREKAMSAKEDSTKTILK